VTSISGLKEELPHLDFDSQSAVDYFSSEIRDHLDSLDKDRDVFLSQNIRRFELNPSTKRAYHILNYLEDEQ